MFRPSAWDFHLAAVQCLGRHLISLYNSNMILIILSYIDNYMYIYVYILYIYYIYIIYILSNSVWLDRVSRPTCCSTGAQLPELDPTSAVIAPGRQAARTCQTKNVHTKRVDFFETWFDLIFYDLLRSSVCSSAWICFPLWTSDTLRKVFLQEFVCTCC